MSGKTVWTTRLASASVANLPMAARANTSASLPITLVEIAVLYVGYSASRTLASDDRGAALGRAKDLLGLEKAWHLDIEQALMMLVGIAEIADGADIDPAGLGLVLRRGGRRTVGDGRSACGKSHNEFLHC